MKNMEADVIVVAAGPAGLAATIAAAEQGAKVITFEKGSTTGGAANMGMGPFAVESRLQKLKNNALTRESAFKMFMEYTHWRVDARLVSEYINKSGATIAWLEKMGVEFHDVIAYVQGGQATHHVVKPSIGLPGPMCAATMLKIMTERAKGMGAEVLLQTPVKKLAREKGKVTGVIAEDQAGEQIRATAKAVIIATGGFGDNPGMIKKQTGFEWGKDLFSFRIPGVAGDGIRMAWEAGAAPTEMRMELTGSLPVMTDPETNMMVLPDMQAFTTFLQPNLMVNLLGERFMNEEAMGNYTFCGNALARQKNRSGFVIVDEGILKDYEKNGFDCVAQIHPVTGEGLVEHMPEACQKDPNMYVANSLDELASKTGINGETLKETVEAYNTVCENGRDYIFYKNARYLKPLKKGKVFAGKLAPGAYGTLGGIKINYKAEVVNKEDLPIPGLYAAGTDACSIYGDSYPFILPGNTMGFALNSGRIAGENAAAYARTMGDS